MGSLGLRYVGVAAGAAILLGGLGGIVALLAGRGRKSAIPFGPFLTAGALVAVFWGERIADWYLRSAYLIADRRPNTRSDLRPKLPRARCLTAIAPWCFVSGPRCAT